MRIAPKQHHSLLHKGSVGKEVRKVENRLKDLGYLKGPANDHFDAATAKAVLAYKEDHGWEAPHGVVGGRAERSLGLKGNGAKQPVGGPGAAAPKPSHGGKTPSKLRGATYNVERDRSPKDVHRWLGKFAKSNKLDFVQVQEINGYHKALNSIPGYKLVTFPKAKDHGESGILVRDGLLQQHAHYLQPKGGWTTVRGGHAAARSPVMVKLAGWLEVASVHQPPSVDWKHGKMVGPENRVDTYRYTSEAVAKFAQRQVAAHPHDGLLIGGDWNEAASTRGKYSPNWIASQAGMTTHGGRNTGHGPIDYELSRGLRMSHIRVGPKGGSDHNIETFTVTRPRSHRG